MANNCGVPGQDDECKFAEQSAEKAVRKTFAILGVNLDEPREVKAFQQSLNFGDTLRRIADKSMLAFIVALVISLAGAFIYGVKVKLTGAP